MSKRINHAEAKRGIKRRTLIIALAAFCSCVVASVFVAPSMLSNIAQMFASEEQVAENNMRQRRQEAEKQALNALYRDRQFNSRISADKPTQTGSLDLSKPSNTIQLGAAGSPTVEQPGEDRAGPASYDVGTATGEQQAGLIAATASTNNDSNSNARYGSRAGSSFGNTAYYVAVGGGSQAAASPAVQDESVQSTADDVADSDADNGSDVPQTSAPDSDPAATESPLPAFAVTSAQPTEMENTPSPNTATGQADNSDSDSDTDPGTAETSSQTEVPATESDATGSDSQSDDIPASQSEQSLDSTADNVAQNSENSEPSEPTDQQGDNQAGQIEPTQNGDNYQFDPDVVITEIESLPGSLHYDGLVKNNGIISIPEQSLLTLSGSLSGSGTFDGDVMLQDNIVNPGNSPGLLTFNDDLVWQSTVFELEIQGTDIRGVDFDAIDVFGDFTLMDTLIIDVILLDGLLLSDLYDEELEIFRVFGDFYNGTGDLLTDPFSLQLSIDVGWITEWRQDQDMWSLFAYVETPVAEVPEPKTILMIILGLTGLFYINRYRRRKS